MPSPTRLTPPAALIAMLIGAIGAAVIAGPGPAVPAPVTAAGRSMIVATAEVHPVRLAVPAIGLDTALDRVGLGDDGTITPATWDRAAWYADGVVPGSIGPAVIVGHVDSASTGPAVFFRLRDLQPGDELLVTRSDGQLERFVVDSSESFPKATFPTDVVYGPTPLAGLRLITCAGDFDVTERSYRDNLVVAAHREPATT